MEGKPHQHVWDVGSWAGICFFSRGRSSCYCALVFFPVPRMLPLVDTIWSGTSGTVSVLVDIALPQGNITAGDFTSSFPITATFAAGQAQVNVSLTLSPGAVEGL